HLEAFWCAIHRGLGSPAGLLLLAGRGLQDCGVLSAVRRGSRRAVLQRCEQFFRWHLFDALGRWRAGRNVPIHISTALELSAHGGSVLVGAFADRRGCYWSNFDSEKIREGSAAGVGADAWPGNSGRGGAGSHVARGSPTLRH